MPSSKSCCVPGCNNTDIKLHHFPNPFDRKEMFEKWIQLIGGAVTEMDPEFVFMNRRVCERHFERKYIYTRILSTLAVPTLCLPGGSSVEDMQLSTDINVTTASATNVGLLHGGTSNLSMEVTTDEPYAHESTTATYNMEIDTKASFGFLHDHAYLQSKRLPPTRNKKKTKEELRLMTELQILKKKVSRITKIKNSLKHRLAVTKKVKKDDTFKDLTKNLSKTAKTFFAMQITQAGKQPKGRRFSTKQKILALSLYKRSPKAYRLLSNICVLPKRSTLQKLLYKLPIKPGINQIIFEELQKKVANMPNNHKYCCLVFDEMSLEPSTRFNQRKNHLVGFVDDGYETGRELCDHVLVFMVRGIFKKYKQPVAFSFALSTTKTVSLIKQLKSVIAEVQKTGLRIVATVCDQGTNNRGAINALINETKEKYLKNNQEMKGTFFEINGNKIYPIYDPPHLIKGIRNNLITKNLQFTDEDSKIKTAKWEHIESLYRRGPGYKGVKLIPKLTAQHVIPNLIPKMRVKHCTQVFSRTVGVALGFMADCGKLPKNAQNTADLLIFFDELFDSLNGSFSKPMPGKIYRSAITPTSPHFRLWAKSLKVIKSMRFIDKNGKTCSVPSLSSWATTIQSFTDLTKHLHKIGLTSILPRHINQDPLENFFGAIRAHGAGNTKPDAEAFEAAYKTLLINNLTSPHSIGSNCENDNGFCLQSLRHLLTRQDSPNPQLEAVANIEEGHLFIPMVNIEDLILSKNPKDIEKSAAIADCSGWLIRKLRKIYKNCNTCKNFIEASEIHKFHKHIERREYSQKKWLCYPSKEMFNLFAQIENVVTEVLKEKYNCKILYSYIETVIYTNLDFTFKVCLSHGTKVENFFIKKSITFFIENWAKEVRGILAGKVVEFDITDPIKKFAYNYRLKNKLKNRK